MYNEFKYEELKRLSTKKLRGYVRRTFDAILKPHRNYFNDLQ